MYDKITDDSLKYVDASFNLKDDYIDNATFEEIKAEIFESMFKIIPKDKFILKSKFNYENEKLIAHHAFFVFLQSLMAFYAYLW